MHHHKAGAVNSYVHYPWNISCALYESLAVLMCDLQKWEIHACPAIQFQDNALKLQKSQYNYLPIHSHKSLSSCVN